jgi:hypothetical protein
VFARGKPFHSNLMFVRKAVAYPSGAPERGSPLGLALGLTANIRLSCKGLPSTNTLPYNENSQITDINCFITLGPGANALKHFCPKFTNFRNKLKCLSLASFSSPV